MCFLVIYGPHSTGVGHGATVEHQQVRKCLLFNQNHDLFPDCNQTWTLDLNTGHRGLTCMLTIHPATSLVVQICSTLHIKVYIINIQMSFLDTLSL